MKQFSLFLGIALAIIFTSCCKEIIRGKGNIGSITMNVPTFTAVETHSDIKAIISYATYLEVTATGYENLLNILDFKVENGVLKLNFNTTYNTIRNGNIVATIKLPVLSSAVIHGNKNLEVSDFSNGASFNAAIHGNGNILVRNCNYQSAVLEIHGRGSIEAQGLQIKEAVSSIHNSGNCSVSVTDKLVAKIFAAGNIYYWGNPLLEIALNGNGKVVKRY